VPAFARSSDFALDKPAGVPCPKLQEDFRCSIHDRLRPAGFPGCAVFDCFGAGQRVTAVFGAAWREDGAAPAEDLAPAFSAARQLSEALWHLLEARERTSGGLQEEVTAAADGVRAMLDAPDRLPSVDVVAVRGDVGRQLARASASVRGRGGRDLAGRDLTGRDLRGADLTGAALRGALLLGADLRGARLVRSDLLGADLRGADLRSADLTDALFLTTVQLSAARVDPSTVLPSWLQGA
jgi:hypothetical protein